MTFPELVNEPEHEWRVTLHNSQDEWEYIVHATTEVEAVAAAKVDAEADGWNGYLLSEPKVERLSD